MNYKKIPILQRMTTTFFFDLFGVLLGADKSTLLNFIAKRTEKKECIVCEKRGLDEDANFCSECGAKLID